MYYESYTMLHYGATRDSGAMSYVQCHSVSSHIAV